MTSETPIDLLKKGFHFTLGATTSLVEAIQDPIKREETLTQLRMGPDAITEHWAEKGAVTEVEARKFLDSLVSQYGPGSTSPGTGSAPPATGPSVDPVLQQELRDLTSQLADLRSQLSP